MKIKSIAAVGAMGAGLGIASFIGGTGTASAACGEATAPPLERIECFTNAELGAFAESTDPFVAADTLLNGNDDDTSYGSLGLTQQLNTFRNSIVGIPPDPNDPSDPGVAGFLGGPISSQDPSAP